MSKRKPHRAPRRWTPEETAQLLDMKRRGLNGTACAVRLGRTSSSVLNRLIELKAPMRPKQRQRRWSDADTAAFRAAIADAAPGRIPWAKLSERFGRTKKSLLEYRRYLAARDTPPADHAAEPAPPAPPPDPFAHWHAPHSASPRPGAQRPQTPARRYRWNPRATSRAQHEAALFAAARTMRAVFPGARP